MSSGGENIEEDAWLKKKSNINGTSCRIIDESKIFMMNFVILRRSKCGPNKAGVG